MRTLYFSESFYGPLDIYIQAYKLYFTELYTDTGIWSQDQILEYYEKAAVIRRNEIIALIKSRLSEESVMGNSGHNSVRILWKSVYSSFHGTISMTSLVS